MTAFLLAFPIDLSGIWSIIRTISFIDVIDIICVSVLIYYLYKFIRDRRAGLLAIGLVLLFVLRILSQVLEMYALQYILQNIFQIGFITLVILFQPELRGLLEKVGMTPIKGLRSFSENRDLSTMTAVIDEVVDAVMDLSESKTGALIVFERSVRLGDMILTGTVIDANPASFLIRNIFFNKAPMHDGALIIRDKRLYAAGCLLPLSNNPDIIKDLGTRHRAGIGMSENSDAVVLIVSEETGMISTAVEGELVRGYTKKTLTKFLRSELKADENDRELKILDIFGKGKGKNEKEDG